jgi:hypothetical protein
MPKTLQRPGHTWKTYLGRPLNPPIPIFTVLSGPPHGRCELCVGRNTNNPSGQSGEFSTARSERFASVVRAVVLKDPG